MLLLDDAVKEAAFWEVENKSREEWLFGYPTELALLAGQVQRKNNFNESESKRKVPLPSPHKKEL